MGIEGSVVYCVICKLFFVIMYDVVMDIKSNFFVYSEIWLYYIVKG